MCDIWRNPSLKDLEIRPKELEILPKVRFINITGGEPFIRKDLEKIVRVCLTKAPRVVISTSGWYEERIIDLAKKYPRIGIRISIEGLSEKNDHLRGRPGGFDKGLRTLLLLKEMGLKDIGFGCTVSNHNSEDMLSLYRLSRQLGLEFATATFHNSYYFHKYDNCITNKEEVIGNFEKLIAMQLKEKHPKSWSRAFFNNGLINYIEGNRRMLPCEAGLVNCFVDPYGEVYPCNGMEERYWMESMGNIRQATSFRELWESDQAQKVREQVRRCPKNCWMVGTAAPVMKKYIRYPLQWMLRNKVRSLLHRPLCLDRKWYDVGQDPEQGNLKQP
jgi:radical SAM protein with 4Fe4S-binding SPASM domain